MARAPETATAAPRKRRSFTRGPRVATILAHVEQNDKGENVPVIDILTFSGNGFDILDKHTELTAAGHAPVLVRYTMPAATKAEEGDDSEG